MQTFIAMTVKGRYDLTKNCLTTMGQTLREDQIDAISLVDATPASDTDQIDVDKMREWLGSGAETISYVNQPCKIVEGWNLSIAELIKLFPNSRHEEVNVWIVNNDVWFRKLGWLDRLNARLNQPGTGIVGSYSMSVFGHTFSTGGIWGFNLANALKVAENGKILDERLNYCCQDVDISIRLANIGLPPTHVPDTEYGPDPYLEHGISKTVMQDLGHDRVMSIRSEEEKILIDKHGRKD